ncbi:MAG: helix-turn-helix transcriptional regulator [Chitinophagaceae bacterium]
MNYLKETRLQWGISQNDFADLLGCTRSQLAMAETGQRELPFASDRMIRRMESTKSSQFQPYAPVKLQADESCLKVLDRDITDRRLKLYRLERSAEQLYVKVQQGLHLIEMAASILQTEPVLDELARLRLELLERQAKQKLTQWQKKWLLCQVEIAGQKAAMANAVELKGG